MKDLQEATEKICALKGNVLAIECVIAALVQSLGPVIRPAFVADLKSELEACEAMLLGAVVSDVTVEEFRQDAQRALARWDR